MHAELSTSPAEKVDHLWNHRLNGPRRKLDLKTVARAFVRRIVEHKHQVPALPKSLRAMMWMNLIHSFESPDP